MNSDGTVEKALEIIEAFAKTINMATMSKGNNSSLAVKRTTTGLGLFTLKPIPASRRIIEYVGQIIDSEEADRRGGKYLFELDEERAIDGTARSNTARYINHSCRPNAEAFTHGNRIWIWSRRKIKAGEEITIHYGKDYMAEHIDPKGCKCPKCIARPEKAKRARGKKGGRK